MFPAGGGCNFVDCVKVLRNFPFSEVYIPRFVKVAKYVGMPTFYLTAWAPVLIFLPTEAFYVNEYTSRNNYSCIDFEKLIKLKQIKKSLVKNLNINPGGVVLLLLENVTFDLLKAMYQIKDKFGKVLINCMEVNMVRECTGFERPLLDSDHIQFKVSMVVSDRSGCKTLTIWDEGAEILFEGATPREVKQTMSANDFCNEWVGTKWNYLVVRSWTSGNNWGWSIVYGKQSIKMDKKDIIRCDEFHESFSEEDYDEDGDVFVEEDKDDDKSDNEQTEN